ADVNSPDAWRFCHAKVRVFAAGAGASAKKKRLLLAKGKAKIAGGKKGNAKLKLTKQGRRALKGKRRVKVRVELKTLEQIGTVKAKRVLLLPKKR
ncbi:MAG: hypothetical protein ACXWXU_08260, partial [Solirubrobacterales bacterium]